MRWSSSGALSLPDPRSLAGVLDPHIWQRQLSRSNTALTLTGSYSTPKCRALLRYLLPYSFLRFALAALMICLLRSFLHSSEHTLARGVRGTKSTEHTLQGRGAYVCSDCLMRRNAYCCRHSAEQKILLCRPVFCTNSVSQHRQISGKNCFGLRPCP